MILYFSHCLIYEFFALNFITATITVYLELIANKASLSYYVLLMVSP